MKYSIFLFLVCTCFQFGFSQENQIPEKQTQKGFAKIDFLSIKMPINPLGFEEVNMGFTGIHYNLNFQNYYAGLGIYGAVSGIRGGFFTLGFNAGFKKNISENLFLDTGLHFGGGGGAGAPDGGGAFILPHVNLGYQFQSFSLTTGYSYINFFDKGNIKNHQLNVAIQIPLSFDYTDSKDSEKSFSTLSLKNSKWNQKSKKTSLMLHFNNLNVTEAERTKDEIIKGKTIQLAGFEFANYFSEKWFVFLKVDGAYRGIKAGYMDVFLGGGYNLIFNQKRTKLLLKVAAGAGGGGGVNSDGGFMLSPDISIEQKIHKDIFISINKGYLLTPSRLFSTSTFGIGLKYYVERNGIISNTNAFATSKFKGIDIILKQDVYINAKRIENPTENMHQISLQFNLDLNKNIYVAGQTSFANFGNAGAYAEGIVGLGIKSNLLFNKTTSIFTQVLGGAAGGGNISTGEGLIIKPSLGIDYKLSNTLNLRSAVGYVKAKGGELSSPFLNFGLKYNFSILTSK